jgi:hypothetical protein
MENKKFRNEITNKALKENLGDLAISLLVNQNLISLEKDLNHLKIEFGYLLMNRSDEPVAMFKVTLPKKLFKSQKTFYFGTQEGDLLLLNQEFTEDTFRKVQKDMFAMHGLDIKNENLKSYIMELY